MGKHLQSARRCEGGRRADDAASALRKNLTSLVRREPARRAQQALYTEPPYELRHGFGHGGLTHGKLSGCCRERPASTTTTKAPFAARRSMRYSFEE